MKHIKSVIMNDDEWKRGFFEKVPHNEESRQVIKNPHFARGGVFFLIWVWYNIIELYH